MPVEDDCALWRFKFPKLTPNDLQKMTGKGVTVFILDTLPDLKVIKDAAEDAGDDNLLLLDVNKNVKFHDVPELPILAPDGTEPVTVGKDVYGRHFPMIMPDHGLFIAGIVSELAPDATVECIRVLNKYGVGDVNLITQALVYIESRMSVGGDLNQQPVVINMSLVIPTVAELMSSSSTFGAGAIFDSAAGAFGAGAIILLSDLAAGCAVWAIDGVAVSVPRVSAVARSEASVK